MATKLALVVRGGWEGHQPVETTDLFIPFLESSGYSVQVHDSPSVYADEDATAHADLIVQAVSMSTISAEELTGLRRAVEAGTGLAGWHGGITGSFDEPGYFQLIGGTFAHHPVRDPATSRGDMDDNYLPHTIVVAPGAAEHPIMAGIHDFELNTEQYWVLSDEYNEVLATTTLATRPWDAWREPVTCPAIWTRRWGDGRVFVCTPGHRVEVLEDANVRAIVGRGMLWASR